MLLLILTTFNKGCLTKYNVIDKDKLYSNPKRTFDLSNKGNTHVEVDIDEEGTFPSWTNYCRSKVKWTPDCNQRVRGYVCKVVIYYEADYIDVKVLLPMVYD